MSIIEALLKVVLLNTLLKHLQIFVGENLVSSKQVNVCGISKLSILNFIKVDFFNFGINFNGNYSLFLVLKNEVNYLTIFLDNFKNSYVFFYKDYNIFFNGSSFAFN